MQVSDKTEQEQKEIKEQLQKKEIIIDSIASFQESLKTSIQKAVNDSLYQKGGR